MLETPGQPLDATFAGRDAVQRDDVVRAPHKFRLVPDAHQLILKLCNKIDQLTGNFLNHFQLPDALLAPRRFVLEKILIHPKIELLVEELPSVFVNEIIDFALPPENLQRLLQGGLLHRMPGGLQCLEHLVYLRNAIALLVGGGQSNRPVLFDRSKSEKEVAFFVGFFVLQRGAIEEKLLPVELYAQVAKKPVGLHIVKHVRLPKEDDILFIGIDPFVDAHVLRRVGKTNRTALAKIARKESVQLIEQFLAKVRKGFQFLRNVGQKLRLDELRKITRLNPHEIDVAGFAIDFRADKQIAQSVKKTAFLRRNVVLGGGGSGGRFFPHNSGEASGVVLVGSAGSSATRESDGVSSVME